jgi:hypothetical protein
MKLTKKQARAYDILHRYTNYRARFIIEDVPEKTFDGNKLFEMYKNEEVDITKIKPILRPFLDLAKPTEITERGEKKTFIPAISIAESYIKPYLEARNWYDYIHINKDNVEFEITEIKPAGEVSKQTQETIRQYEELLAKDSTSIPPKVTYNKEELEALDKSVDFIMVSVKRSYLNIRLTNDRKKNNLSVSGVAIKELNMANFLSFYHWLHSWQFATQIVDKEFISFDKAKELGYNITGEK